MRPTPSSHRLIARSTRLLVFFLLSVLLSETVILPVAPVRAAPTSAGAVIEPLAIRQAPVRAPQTVEVSALPPERDMPSTFIAASNAYTMSAALESSHGPVTGFNGSFDAPGGKVVYEYPGVLSIPSNIYVRIPIAANTMNRIAADVTMVKDNSFDKPAWMSVGVNILPRTRPESVYDSRLSLWDATLQSNQNEISSFREGTLINQFVPNEQPFDLVLRCNAHSVFRIGHCLFTNLRLIEDTPGWTVPYDNQNVLIGSVQNGALDYQVSPDSRGAWRKAWSYLFRLPSLQANDKLQIRFRHARSSMNASVIAWGSQFLIKTRNFALSDPSAFFSLGLGSIPTVSTVLPWTSYTLPVMTLNQTNATQFSGKKVFFEIAVRTATIPYISSYDDIELLINGQPLPGISGLAPYDDQQAGCSACDQAADTQADSHDPVNTFSGSFHTEVMDLALPAASQLLAMQRSYVSLGAGTTAPVSDLGPGWRHRFATRLTLPHMTGGMTNTVIFESWTGNRLRFFETSTGGYSPAPGVHARMQRDGYDYVLTMRDQHRLRFNEYGWPTTVTRNYVDGTPTTGTSDTDQVTTTAYAPLTGRVLGSQDVLGRWVSQQYDALGRSFQTIQNCRDGAGSPVTTGCAPFAGGTINAPTALADRNLSQTTVFDALGRVTETLDSYGQRQHTSYDGLGRSLRQTANYMDGVFDAQQPDTDLSSSTTYDALGQVRTSTDASGATTQYGLNGLGQTTVITDSMGRVTRQGFDGQGSLRWRQQQDGRLEVVVLDGLGRQIGSFRNYENGMVTVDDPADRDVLTSTVYDRAGRVLQQISAGGQITQFTYDQRDRLIAVTENLAVGACLLPPCDVVTRYAYDRAGNRRAHTDANQHTRTWQYDAAGRMVSATDALNVITSYQYDAAGRMTAITDPRGASASQTLQYTDLDQLTTRQIASMGTITQQYNARGQRTALGDATGSTTFQYDAMGRITQVSAPQTGTVGYGYDARGLRSSLTYPDGTQIQYAYWQDGRLETVQQGSTTLASYGYDSQGRLTQITRANGVVTSYGYDSVDRLTSIQYQGSTSGSIASTLDREGQRTQVVETLPSLPQRSISYAYDGLQRLVRASENPGTTQTYAYDLAGNRTGVWINGTQTQSLSYNAANQVDGWSYDAVGNLLSDGTQSSSYDALNRVLSVGSSSNTYNGDGTLVQQNTTSYTQDLAAPLSQILSDGTNRFVYGTPAERLFGEAAGVKTWYLTDALGSLRATLDDAGMPIAAANYDAWGVPETPLIAPFGFTGELQQGSDVWLRARWYGAGRGGFGSRDPYAGDAQTPYSMQYYQYGYSNPVSNRDPSGEAVTPGQFDEGETPCRPAPLTVEWPSEPPGAVNEQAMVHCLRMKILHYAAMHARPDVGFTTYVTASLIGAIMMMETGSVNPKDLYWNWPGSRLYNRFAPGGNASLGAGNFRPTVVMEILCGRIPLGRTGADGMEEYITADLHLSYITKKIFMNDSRRNWLGGWLHGIDMQKQFIQSDKALITQLLDDVEFTIDLIGANIERGIIRAQQRNIRPSVFNIATWHNCGVQDVTAIARCTTDGMNAPGYGRLITTTLVDAAAQQLAIPQISQDLRFNKDEHVFE